MADFIDIPIDVTAEQIEEMAKRQVDTVARKNSTNLITSGAVADIEIDSENILPDTVETQHIKSRAITGAKIAEKTVDTEHIKSDSITPEELDREYAFLGSPSALIIRADSLFHNFIYTNAHNISDLYSKICMFAVMTSSGLLYDAGISGRCIGYYTSETEFVFTVLSSSATYTVVFDEEGITSIEGGHFLPCIVETYQREDFEDIYTLFDEQRFWGRNVRAVIGYYGYRYVLETYYTVNSLGPYSRQVVKRYSSNKLTEIKERDVRSVNTKSEWADNAILSGINESITSLETSVGDIDTALDSIIAIQESYIGGAEE